MFIIEIPFTIGIVGNSGLQLVVPKFSLANWYIFRVLWIEPPSSLPTRDYHQLEATIAYYANRERNLDDEHGDDGDGGGDHHHNHSNNHHDVGVNGDELLSLKVKMMVMMVASIFDEYLKCI